MKQLILLRHAEADQGPRVRDRDRPLTARGAAAANRVGEALRDAGIAPGLVLTSPALRARATARAVVEVCGGTVLVVDELYLADPGACLEVLAEWGEPHETLLIVGHNPGLEELAGLLGGARVGLAPADLVRLELDLDDWSDVPGAPRGRRIDSGRPGSPA